MTDRAQLPLSFEPSPRRRRSGVLRHHHLKAHATVDEAIAGEQRAIRQEDVLLAWFEVQTYVLPNVRFTPSQVWKMLGEGLGWPLTSVRRCLTGLVRDGSLLHHPGDRRDGMYGAKEGTWSLAR